MQDKIVNHLVARYILYPALIPCLLDFNVASRKIWEQVKDMDYFIKEKIKIKYYVRYQDDFLLFHSSKEYLKYCLSEIKKFLTNEKLTLNKKIVYLKVLIIFYFGVEISTENILDTEELKGNQRIDIKNIFQMKLI